MPTQSGSEGMSDNIGKPWPVAALPVGWAGAGQVHPSTHVVISLVSQERSESEKGVVAPIHHSVMTL